MDGELEVNERKKISCTTRKKCTQVYFRTLVEMSLVSNEVQVLFGSAVYATFSVITRGAWNTGADT